MIEETNQKKEMTWKDSWNEWGGGRSIDWYALGTVVASISVACVINHLPIRKPLPKPVEAVRIEQIDGIQKAVATHLNSIDKIPATDKTNYFNATGFNDASAERYFVDLQREKTSLALTDAVIDYNKSVRDNTSGKKRRESQSTLAGVGTFFLLIGGNMAYHLLRRRKSNSEQ